MAMTFTLANLKAGTECWAWQYDWPDALSMPTSSMRPSCGILTEQPGQIGDVTRNPGWFVPYIEKSKNPAFAKAVRVEAVNLANDQETAENAYNNAVRAVATRFLNRAAMAQSDLIKTERDGFVNGMLENYIVMRPDMTQDYAGIMTEIRPCLTPLPGYGGGLLLDWETFAKLEQRGDINRFDGFGNLHLDGKGCDNAVLDLCRGIVYVPDSYAIPFERVPEVFCDHEIQVLWFNK